MKNTKTDRASIYFRRVMKELERQHHERLANKKVQLADTNAKASKSNKPNSKDEPRGH